MKANQLIFALIIAGFAANTFAAKPPPKPAQDVVCDGCVGTTDIENGAINSEKLSTGLQQEINQLNELVNQLQTQILILEEQTLDAGAIYRWTTFTPYSHGLSWHLNNDPDMHGGVAGSSWTNGVGEAALLSSDKEVLRTIFTRKGYGGKNAVIINEVHSQTVLSIFEYVGGVAIALFRIKNTTNQEIYWSPSFYYSCGTGLRASVAVNGTSIWDSGTPECTGASNITLPLSIPGNQVSSAIFVSSTGPAIHPGSNIILNGIQLAFFNDSLALPAGLEFVDDIDSATGGWDQ